MLGQSLEKNMRKNIYTNDKALPCLIIWAIILTKGTTGLLYSNDADKYLNSLKHKPTLYLFVHKRKIGPQHSLKIVKNHSYAEAKKRVLILTLNNYFGLTQ